MFTGFLIRMLFHWVCSRPNLVSSFRPGSGASMYGCLPLPLPPTGGLPKASAQMNQPLLSVVIPVFREGAQLSSFLTAVRGSLSQCNLPYELVLVDDGSPDDTWRVITAEAESCQAIRALRLSRN